MTLTLNDGTPVELLEYRSNGAMVRASAPVDGPFTLVSFDEDEGHATYIVPLSELRIQEAPLKRFLVGNVYAFLAEDADHAVEQYHDAMHQLDATEANYVREDNDE